ncbi:hypothetical protein Ato02nite_060410 [Paractinoplanes toevensis]|uniref:Uncharacterized protein n=2 Tax=Paractinoplanes toevensis TaxID=571911 RepID=A0A919W754_9ACTN|nr:hypothetical protein Ato02nite_060410 [Actinoplanes toevensis]
MWAMRAVIFGYFVFRSHRRNAVPSDIAPTEAPVPTADRHDRSHSVAHEPTERPHSRSATATPQRRPGNQPPGIAPLKSMIFVVRRKGPDGKPLRTGETVHLWDR